MLHLNLLNDFVDKLLAMNKEELKASKGGPSKRSKSHKKGSLSEGGNTNDHGVSAVRLIQSAEYITQTLLETASKPPKWPIRTKFFPYVKKL